jgi:hypothetical protein
MPVVTTRDVPVRPTVIHGGVLLLLGVPLLLILLTLGQLCRSVWFADGSPLSYQAFLPLGALALAWHRRRELVTIVSELATLFPDPNHPKRRGNESLVLIGGVLLLVGILAALPPLGLLGFLVVVTGVVFYLWGPFVVRGLRGPLGYLLLTLLPPPMAGITGRLGTEFHLRNVAFAGYVLKASVQGTMITPQGQNPLYVPASFGGLETLLAALAFSVLVILWHPLRLGAALLMLFTAVVLALVLNVVRVLLLVKLQDARWLPLLPTLLVAMAALWFLGRFLARRQGAQEERLG